MAFMIEMKRTQGTVQVQDFFLYGSGKVFGIPWWWQHPPRKEPGTMWEYKLLRTTKPAMEKPGSLKIFDVPVPAEMLESQLTMLGVDGWEAVGMVGTNLLLKREYMGARKVKS